LTVEQILAWADQYHAATGRWPRCTEGEVAAAPAETWRNLDNLLRHGLRGLPGGSSLPRLLAEHRGVRNAADLPRLTEEDILTWADDYRRRTGGWPTCDAGAIPGAPGEVWDNIDQLLRQGGRGHPGGTSLARLLAERRGARHHLGPPALSEEQIVAWAEEYRRRTGSWPAMASGEVAEAPGETWRAIDHALKDGRRGLPGGDSLAALLARRLGARNRLSLPRLEIKDILSWAYSHHEQTGEWPRVLSGPVAAAPGESWLGVDSALREGLRGLRGLRGGSSLARLLTSHRGVRNKAQAPRLTEEKILKWADGYFRRTGKWPGQASGPIPEAPGETWRAVESALREGLRGLPGGDSVHLLLVRHNRKCGRGSNAGGT
jgi:hypothetical protein